MFIMHSKSSKVNFLCDKYIPKIKIKDSCQPPWYDSDVFRLNKKKSTSENYISNRNPKAITLNIVPYVNP